MMITVYTFRAFDKIKPTAVGLDSLHYWFLRIAAYTLQSLPLTYLFNLSLLQ